MRIAVTMTSGQGTIDREKPALSPRKLSQFSKGLYNSGPLLMRKLQHWRPYICPFEALIDHVPEGATVLDAGCGGGLFLALLAASGKRITGHGFDISPMAIGVAVEMAKAAKATGSALHFEVRPVGDQWPHREFDVVSLVDVMHHVPPPVQREFLLMASRHVRSGGLLIYKDMCRRPRWRAAANRFHDLVLARQWIHYLPIRQVEHWAGEAGMHLVHSGDRLNRLWYGHELRIFRKRADSSN
jgi:2-polyprenyl-3-methyl-5-hydroxy-6-metoxy-1,4-benzoquinol methylase